MATPTLTALMCDGMGSFTDLEYKRMLLAFDRIYYLLPDQPVEFRDVTGRTTHLFFPERILSQSEAFVPCTFELDEPHRDAVLRAGTADMATTPLREAAAEIPPDELLYTWRVVNADGGLGGGRSIGLAPSEAEFAHLLLLNKFLLACDAHRRVPITGKAYVHRLLTLKHQHAGQVVRTQLPDLLPPPPSGADVKHGPFVASLVSEFIPDAELEAISISEIVEYKERNAALFEEFSLTVRTLVADIASLPAEPSFQRDVTDLIATTVWKKQQELQRELRSAWEALFLGGVKEAIRSDTAREVARTAVKAAASLALGVLPQFTPGALTLASALAVGGAVAPWVVAELVDTFTRQREARQNGLYYLLGFQH